jgi:cardiolipin synthase
MKNHWSNFKIIVLTVFITLASAVIYANMRNPHKELNYSIISPPAVEDPKFPKVVGDLLDPSFESGNAVETLLNGDEIFPAMLDAIRGAKKTITFESYIYWSGKVGEEFAKALAGRASAGVHVHLLLDWAGSGKIKQELIELMKGAGVEVERYHAPHWYNITRMNNRTHRKVLVVDGKTGFTGGVGIADEWGGKGLDAKHWRDTHYKVQGPVVNQMQSAFMDNWLKVRPEVHTGEDYFPALKSQGSSVGQMFISSSSEGGSSVRILYLTLIGAAQKSIYLQSAYFVPDQHTIDQMIAAHKRGVEIFVMVPGEYTDSTVVDYASREMWGDLLKAGIKFYQYNPALFHCKVFVVDEFFTSVGSTNFDQRSFRLNDEANLNVLDRKLAQRQITDFENDQKHSTEITFEMWQHRPLSEKFWGKVAILMNSQL